MTFYDDDLEEGQYHDGFRFSRAHGFACDLCGCGTHRSDAHIIPGESLYSPCFIVCHNCYEKDKQEKESHEDAKTQFTEIIEEFSKKISSKKEVKDE